MKKETMDMLIALHLDSLQAEIAIIYERHFIEVNELSSNYSIIIDPDSGVLSVQPPSQITIDMKSLMGWNEKWLKIDPIYDWENNIT